MQLTRDHSLVQSLVDAGMLTPGEALDHPNANVITRAVGVAPDLKVETASGDVTPGDQFILASDGLTRLVDDRELAAALLSESMEEAADRLIEMVLSRGAPDNATIVIVKVKSGADRGSRHAPGMTASRDGGEGWIRTSVGLSPGRFTVCCL